MPLVMAQGSVARHVILTGPPGIGKTTLIHKACTALQSLSVVRVTIQGFYTEEVRTSGRRVGFDVVALDGQRSPLARIDGSQASAERQATRDYRVGPYHVELASFEKTALPALKLDSKIDRPVFVIDEIGKMELFSKPFIQTVRNILDDPNSIVLATIPVPKGKPIQFVEEIRSRNDAKLYVITRENRNAILDDIVATVAKSVQTPNSSQ